MFPIKVFGDGHDLDRVFNDACIDFVERWELFIDHWYPDGFWPEDHRLAKRVTADGVGVRYSCGFGHTEGGDNPPFEYVAGQSFTLEEARRTLAEDMSVKARYVSKIIPESVPLSRFMFGALTSTVFQFGQGRLAAAADGFLDTKRTVPLIKPIRPFEMIAEGHHIDGSLELLKLNFKTDGGYHRGLQARRACELALFWTKQEK